MNPLPIVVLLVLATMPRAAVGPTFAVAAYQPPRVTGEASRTITFDGPAGSPIDPAVWNHETGGGGWGNGELETYTDSAENSYLDGAGNLRISAYRTGTGFTSARITTQDKVVVQPGSYVEASIVAPVGAGVWPAFWAIGANIGEVGWPACGELDIFEGTGATPTEAHAAVHLAAADDPATDKSYGWGEPGGTTDVGSSLEDGPHRYGVYFDDKIVRFYLDRRPTMTVPATAALNAGRSWPFGGPQYLILNVAVDGTTDNSATVFPRTMTVHPISIWHGGVPF
ncbi:beta-glucanase (GH16 family) [Actinoplanes tereljensis]|uniref:Hydrolase n=1 Tax=Paractinoplanes tereljensis TaxID=571912 RepID=A0A919NNK4_9ACTN|nr:glycoside hydrolase family 16 protein [Actinoplanes tereljensis]GIF21062.1 hydrolase [Actinoplanes tereljensis]